MSTALAIPIVELGGVNHLFKPIQPDELTLMLDRYQNDKSDIEAASEYLGESRVKNALSYILKDKDEAHRNCVAANSVETSLKALSSDYWQRALDLTDVYNHMPNKRREEWRENIRKWDVPMFEMTTVVHTLRELLISRDKFLAERVDGIFRALSSEHVTNRPEGFSKRMIISNVVEPKWGSPQTGAIGYIDDLRILIAKFMKREVGNIRSYSLVENLYKHHSGKWVELDGGAMRIRVYLKGTAHLEIHPDMAWRLNDILSILYPSAIPSAFRHRPKASKKKEFDLTQDLIPLNVTQYLFELEQAYEWDYSGHTPRRRGLKANTYRVRNGIYDKHTRKQFDDVMIALGGKRAKVGNSEFQFDYDFMEIRDEVAMSGKIPDKFTHQFYPTPEPLAQEAVGWLDIQDGDKCLEPSAGQGGLAKFMAGDVTAVEVSDLNCKVLGAVRKDNPIEVINDDFLRVAPSLPLFDKICMNPPFSQGRAKLHVEAAMEKLKTGGVLVAIVPPSMMEKLNDSRFTYEWSEVKERQFVGTGVSVVMVRVVRV